MPLLARQNNDLSVSYRYIYYMEALISIWSNYPDGINSTEPNLDILCFCMLFDAKLITI